MNEMSSGGRIDIGGVIQRTFDIYVDQAPVLLPAAAVVFVFTGILSAVLIASSPALALVSYVISLAAATVFTGMVVELVADLQDGRRDASVGQLLNSALPFLGQLVLVGIVSGLAIVFASLLLLVPGLILLTLWTVAAPVVVIEHPGVFAALGRSRELVRGNGWAVFGVLVVLVIGVGAVSIAFELIGAAVSSGVGIVVRVIVGVLTAPITALAQSVLYFDLRGKVAPAPPVDPFGAPPTGPPSAVV
jgi:hypothetical protein